MPSRLVAGLVSGLVVTTSALIAAPALAALPQPALEVVRPTSPQIDMPTSYPVQPELRVFPDNPDDRSIARGVMPYDEIAPLLNELMDTTDRVSAQVVGTSALGRDIYLVTVTAPETAEQTAQQAVWRDAVKYTPAAAASDPALQAGYKVPIWFNGNIHGNEWEGTDATLNYIAELATSTDPSVVQRLASHRIYFTVTNNPDGRALGQRGTANGYDPNRDFVTGATAEASIVRDLASIIQPTYFIDLHGYTNVLQVEPCGPPHGENYEYDLFVPHAYATALEIEKAVVEADIPGNTYLDRTTGRVTTTNTGNINIPFRDIRAGWDDWPPIFAPQYVAYQGGITNTVELPLGRSGDQPARAAVNIAVAEIVIDTVVTYVDDHSAALLDNQIEIFRRGVAGEPSRVIPADISADDLAAGVPTEWVDIWDETDVYNADYPRAYVIPMDAAQRSASDAQTLVQQLLVNDVQVSTTTAPFTAGGVTYPAGSYYVDMHQPLRGLANVLLDEGSDISARVPDMYDISAWSLALLWGADVVPLGETTDAAPTTALQPVDAVALDGVVPEAGTYLTFEPRGVADYQAVNALLAEGIPLSQLADGTIVLGPDEATYSAAVEAAELFGVDFAASDGRRVRDEPSTALRTVRVGYANSTDDRDALLKLGFADSVPVTAATLTSGEVDLTAIDLLFVGANLTFNGQQESGRAAVQAYIAAGKPVVGRGTAGAAFVNAFVTPVTAVTGTSGSNGIARVTTPADGVLGDYPQDTAFGYPFAWFTGFGEGVTVEQSYASEGMFVSGHWAPSTGRSQQDASGAAAAISVQGSSGTRAFLFGTSPTFRNHPVGGFGDIARAVFWAAGAGSSAVAPPPAVIAADLVDATRGGISVSGSVEPGATVTVQLGEDLSGQSLSGLLFSEPVPLAAATASGTSLVLSVPATVPEGDHRLAVLRADGSLLGWTELVVALVPDPEPTLSPEPTASPEPTGSPEPSASPEPTASGTPAPGAAPVAGGGDLAATGGGDAGRWFVGALAVLAFGAGLIVLRRARLQ